MLLKWPTSEYQLEYKNLPIEVRKQIWEENLKCREYLAENNRVEHFWNFQKLNGDKKLGELVANISTTHENGMSNSVENGKENGVDHRATWPNNTTQESNRVLQLPIKSALKVKLTEKPSQIQTDTSEMGQKDVAIQTPRWESKITKSTTYEPAKIYPEPYFSSNLSTRMNKRITHETASRSKSNEVLEKKSPPFMSYGWNDKNKDVGSKRTFNIHASTDEIYPAALHALSQRREMLKLHEASRHPSRPSTAPPLSPVNHSSIWMTEYQDIFSRKRPQSAPFPTKSVRRH